MVIPGARWHSSEWEVSEASVRGATDVAHGVPDKRAGELICKQSPGMALAIQNLIRAPLTVPGRLLIAARGQFASRDESGRKGFS